MQEVYKFSKLKMIQELAKLVKTKRQNLNKSITLLSDEIEMTKSMWADLEKGKKDPQLSTIWRICQGLEIPLSDFIKELEIELGKGFSLID